MTLYVATKKVIPLADRDSYLRLNCHVDMYGALVNRGLCVRWNGSPDIDVDFVYPDGTIVNDSPELTTPGINFDNGHGWRSQCYAGFPMGKLIQDGFLEPLEVAASVVTPRPAVKVDNRRNDGPCPVCGTRTVEFACFTSISYICPQCKG